MERQGKHRGAVGRGHGHGRLLDQMERNRRELDAMWHSIGRGRRPNLPKSPPEPVAVMGCGCDEQLKYAILVLSIVEHSDKGTNSWKAPPSEILQVIENFARMERREGGRSTPPKSTAPPRRETMPRAGGAGRGRQLMAALEEAIQEKEKAGVGVTEVKVEETGAMSDVD